MKYLEASRLLREARFHQQRSLLLICSGQAENLDIYLRAEFAREGLDCQVGHTPFNTLQQHLITAESTSDLRASLLLPWDFLPLLDWRSGIVGDEPDPDACLESIASFSNLLRARGGVSCFVDAPTPPAFTNRSAGQKAIQALRREAIAACDHYLDGDAFGLQAYLDSGQPIVGRYCGEIAGRLAGSLLERKQAPRRVLVTDLDNTTWAGVIGEDGAENIHYGAEGKGYPHYLYQAYLKKLERAGILIAAVSKNDADLASGPFHSGDMLLKLDDLVTIQASYYPKSVQIERIAESLNLPLDAFLFVDDNPVEIGEVKTAHAEVACLQFPADVGELAAFFDRLGEYFDLRPVTAEDSRRTALYRSRLLGMAPATGDGAALDEFLRGLAMSMRICERSAGDNERALQLFNKTNQFNLNGLRIDRAELDRRLAAGGRLYTASVADRHGDHGEVIACLQNPAGAIELLVMSCRVFQRRIEHRFLGWIADQLAPSATELQFDYRPTERNTPVRLFFEAQGIAAQAGWLALPRVDFRAANAEIDNWFDLTVG